MTTRNTSLGVLGLVVASVGIYANSLPNPLLRDDEGLLRNDPRATNPSRWRQIFTQTYWGGLGDDPLYRPLATLSFLANHLVTGDRPWGYRIVNISLHAAVSVIVYLLGVRLRLSPWAAWLSGIYFAVHAVHTEAVIYIVGRADVAATLLLLATLYIVLGVRPGQALRPRQWAAVLLLSAGAMLFKESGFVVLPMVVWARLWNWWTLDRQAIRSASHRRLLVLELILVLAVGVVCCSILGTRYALFGRLARSAHQVAVLDNPLGYASPLTKTLTGISLLGKYLGLLAWPDPLSTDYSFNQISGSYTVTDRPFLVTLAWVAGIAGALWWIRRRGEARSWQFAVWSLGYFAITYSIISNVVLLIGTIFAERLIYMPSVAWCWAFGTLAVGIARRVKTPGRNLSRNAERLTWRCVEWVAHRFSGGGVNSGELMSPTAKAMGHPTTGFVRIIPRSYLVSALCGAVLVANAVLTVQRNRDWRDGLALWKQATAACPNSSRCHSGLSMAYEAEGRIDLAIQHMEKAISIYNLEPDDHYHLGEQYARKRQFEKAILSLGAAYELAHGKTKVQAAFRIGQCRMELGHPAEAVRAFRAVLELNPNHVLALNNLAYLEATSQPPVRDVDSAVGHVERALKLAPNALFVVDTAVDVCSAKGDRRRAVELLRGTLKLAASNDPLRPRLEQRLAELTGAPPTTTRP